MIGFSQPLVRQIHQTEAFENASQEIDGAQSDRDSGVLPHVAVDEERAGWRQDPARLAEHLEEILA